MESYPDWKRILYLARARHCTVRTSQRETARQRLWANVMSLVPCAGHRCRLATQIHKTQTDTGVGGSPE